MDKSVFDGITFVLKINEEYGRYRCTYIGGDVVCSFLTNDDIYNCIPNMGNILTPHSIITGEENIYFFTPHFKFNKRDRVDDNTFLSTDENSVDPFDYHVSSCGKDSFKKLRIYKIL